MLLGLRLAISTHARDLVGAFDGAQEGRCEATAFTVEILDDDAAARARITDLMAEDASVFTGASEKTPLRGALQLRFVAVSVSARGDHGAQ